MPILEGDPLKHNHSTPTPLGKGVAYLGMTDKATNQNGPGWILLAPTKHQIQTVQPL